MTFAASGTPTQFDGLYTLVRWWSAGELVLDHRGSMLLIDGHKIVALFRVSDAALTASIVRKVVALEQSRILAISIDDRQTVWDCREDGDQLFLDGTLKGQPMRFEWQRLQSFATVGSRNG